MGFKPADRGARRLLEAAMLDDPHGDAAIDQYGEHLRAAGDARGDLIELDAAFERAAPPERDRLIAQRRALFHDCGPTLAPASLIEMAARSGERSPGLEVSLGRRSWLRWRRGFIRAVQLDISDCVGGRLQAVVDELLAHPAAMLLEDLRLAPAPVQRVSYPDLIGAIAWRRPPLSRLELGALGDHVHPAWFELGDLRRLWPALSRLSELVIAGRAPILGPIDLDELERLTLRCDGSSDQPLLDIGRSSLPRLAHLAIDLGRSTRINPRATAAIVDSPSLPRLASLAITSAGPITGPLLRQLLGDAPRLARLRVLDLSNGELDDGDADRLAARHRDLDHLERLDLSNTGLSDTARSRLGSTLTRIAVLLL
jgi:hypothetical protein